MENVENQEFLQCPYEPSHRILKNRMQVHLGRCRKNHKLAQKVTCPFNSEHVLNKEELDWHVTVCPQRQYFENFRHHEETVCRPTEPPPMPTTTINDGENWDNDPDVPTYNPQKYASQANVVRNIQGAPPSVRKQFRREERLRLLGINNK